MWGNIYVILQKESRESSYFDFSEFVRILSAINRIIMKKIIIGVDEAGRWPWAWPVMAGACIFLKKSARLTSLIQKLNDSKKLTEKARILLFHEIQTLEKLGVLATGIGQSSNETIDTVGIKPANKLAMQQAVETLLEKINLPHESVEIQIDGNDKFSLHGVIPSKSIIKWDAKVKQISAASILAKVTRDFQMEELAKIYPEYGFEKHKWYGTIIHQNTLEKYGICAIHRKNYAPIKRILEKNWF